ncbi:protein kinase [Reticulomyxa filosa]|uniref:non-specific serine/threonine protein kinase n=1 Tax=Reticulomyxa filosa TaxID=46433 RepID=X6N8A3_RETFI|nr:protein kinase [Reticulomyxa filosa]|eukprot:ETO21969.1 protein kinase [Reticulomyxa filosa]
MSFSVQQEVSVGPLIQLEYLPSEATLEKVEKMKQKVASTVQNRIRFQEEREKRLMQVNKKLQQSTLDVDKKTQYLETFLKNERNVLRKERHKVALKDFTLIRVIGKGGFGEVRVVRNKHSQQVFAMKTMRKRDMVDRHQVVCAKSEKALMEKAIENRYLVKLHYSFQDDTYLYLVMEYCGGGDFMGLLVKLDLLTEAQTAFYIAEITLAIHAVHELGFVHRDLKPDNILIASNGHVKLTDFGLAKEFNTLTDTFVDTYTENAETSCAYYDHCCCKEYKAKAALRRRDRKLMYSTVGTPDYIAPEVFRRTGYDKMVDWWSMGVILFEALMGYPPFYDDDLLRTCDKIVHYRQYFNIPNEVDISPSCTDLIRNLLCSRKKRFGFSQIHTHPWFRERKINFNKMNNTRPPFIPCLRHDTDGHFTAFETEQKDITEEKEFGASKPTSNSHFWGYTFKAPVDLHGPQLEELFKQIEKEDDELKQQLSVEDNNINNDHNIEEKENECEYHSERQEHYDKPRHNRNLSSEHAHIHFRASPSPIFLDYCNDSKSPSPVILWTAGSLQT